MMKDLACVLAASFVTATLAFNQTNHTATLLPTIDDRVVLVVLFGTPLDNATSTNSSDLTWTDFSNFDISNSTIDANTSSELKRDRRFLEGLLWGLHHPFGPPMPPAQSNCAYGQCGQPPVIVLQSQPQPHNQVYVPAVPAKMSASELVPTYLDHDRYHDRYSDRYNDRYYDRYNDRYNERPRYRVKTRTRTGKNKNKYVVDDYEE